MNSSALVFKLLAESMYPPWYGKTIRLTRRMQNAAALIGAFCLVTQPASGQERMVVDRYMLIYDLSEGSGLPESEQLILPNDHILLSELLMENPSVDTIVVAGGGGFSFPAYEMAAKIEAFGLNTIARDTCSSACTTILLGGLERSMEPGTRLGFHRGSQAANYLKEVFVSQKEEQGWNDEFAFAAYVFERGEIAARDYIDFLVRRGVSVSFALRTQTYSSSDMWYPPEEEMFRSGVLTRRPKIAQEEMETP